MSEADNTPDFSKEEKRLFQLLLIYCVGVSACRLIGPTSDVKIDVASKGSKVDDFPVFSSRCGLVNFSIDPKSKVSDSPRR
jgi:hypothetical protein